MFLPSNLKDTTNEEKEEAERKQAYVRIEEWALELIPETVRIGVQISVQEVACGDPECSPIDTAVAVLFQKGGRGMTGLPMLAREVEYETLKSSFPTPEVLLKWSRGEDAEWPPLEDDYEDEYEEGGQMDDIPHLRFQVGAKVECRLGPDPVTGWTKGEIIQLWYREPGWPPNSFAPYKVELEDGKKIFAPADLDHVIRALKL